VDEAEENKAAAEITWTSFPARDDFPRSALLIMFIVAFSWGVVRLMGHPGWGLLSFLVLTGAMHRYFIRTYYRLHAGGITARALGRTLERPWATVRGVYPHKDGVFLSPFDAPSRLDSFRGMYLRYGPSVVGSEVQAFVERHASPGEGATVNPSEQTPN
jgi:hypothetical protein